MEFPYIELWMPIVVLVCLAFLVDAFGSVVHQPALSRNAPKWFQLRDWPILGAVRFYSHRSDFMTAGSRQSPTGNFSFRVGKKHVIGLSGHDGRDVFFNSKALDFSAGFIELFTGGPTTSSDQSFHQGFFNKNLLLLMKGENFVKNLPLLNADILKACRALVAAPKSTVAPEWRVTDPFFSMYVMVYQLTVRTLGANEVADDEKLLRYTLDIFQTFQQCESPTRVAIPWMPTWNYVRQYYCGLKLAIVFKDIIRKRQATGKRDNDALQFLIDQGGTLQEIIPFQIGVLFAGLINTGIVAAWLHIHLTQSPVWMSLVRKEVDDALRKYRSTAWESEADILGRLTVSQWESEFSTIHTCLRECIRWGIPGTGARKNTTNHDIPIGKTGEVIPSGAYAVLVLDDVHMDKKVYEAPDTFDPGRFNEERAEDKKVPFGYLGWGAGRHPCLGMRFAKLEMTMITVYFVVMFDFELSDRDGNHNLTPPPPIDRNQPKAQIPSIPQFLRYKLRHQF
ncbi:putative cytochrome p450 6a1 [Rosellinia necatrix]|uniref:Putative cytochrome p450 6a1 n=1 Tax=Rosellinia necatrix TaxID=77044 RepID=A0A1S7UNT3_ROSNE|nr:putative cytochrome p450 6a1 [Rosellinia necatrix]